MNGRREFPYCPSCGSKTLTFDGIKQFSCDNCGLVWYQNTAAACGAILLVGEKVLLLERAVEPAKGMLDFPGGFVEPGESLETGLAREIEEEIGLLPLELSYLTSAPNVYLYKGVAYNTCDVVFTGTLSRAPTEMEEGEVAGILLLRREEIDLERIAFPSLRSAMALFIQKARR
ncbi:MAG: NUDIX hydrolase [Alkalispirochaetaceae bacterium]